MKTTPHRSSAPPLTCTVAEAADLLDIHATTIYRAIADGTFELPVIRIGRVLRISRTALERYAGGLPPSTTE